MKVNIYLPPKYFIISYSYDLTFKYWLWIITLIIGGKYNVQNDIRILIIHYNNKVKILKFPFSFIGTFNVCMYLNDSGIVVLNVQTSIHTHTHTHTHTHYWTCLAIKLSWMQALILDSVLHLYHDIDRVQTTPVFFALCLTGREKKHLYCNNF